MMFKLFLALILLPVMNLIAEVPAAAPRSSVLQNGNFAEGEVGQVPKGWIHPKVCAEAGFRAEVVEDASLPGKRGAVIFRELGKGQFGNLMQALDATPYRGKRVRLRTQLSVESREGARGQLWLRVDLPDQKMGFFDNMDERPVTEASWVPAEIIGDVDPQAINVALGVMLVNGNGRLRLAPVTLEVLGETPKILLEGPRALTPRGLQNLSTFAKAFAYTRFFHPSDEAAKADWNRLAAEGARSIEGAASVSELASKLNSFFAPYAPSAQFLAPGEHKKPWKPAGGAKFAVRWRHNGFGQAPRPGPNATYHSEREFVLLSGRAGKGWVDPQTPAILEVGSGVRLALPMTCVADANKRTLPRAQIQPGQPTLSALPQPTAGSSGSGDDRATRLGDVVLAWGVFQHFYPYFDVVKTDWAAELPRALAQAAEDKNGERFTVTLRKLVASLHDGHGGVYGNEAGRAVPSLGLAFVDGWPIVEFTGPSARALPAGSKILAVDGETVGARLAQMREETSAATSGWLEARFASELLAGLPSTTLTVSYLSSDGVQGTATLQRDSTPWELRSKDPRRPLPLAEIRPGIWYADLNRIQEKEFSDALPKLAMAKGVIFDLREYPRIRPSFLQHLTDKPLQSANWNVPIVTQPDGKGWEWDISGRWNLEPKEPSLKGRIAFLTGGGAISYAESCLGIIEAYKLAEIVGAPSAGTNGNVNPFTLPGGYQIIWTGMKVLKHDGSQHHGVGIRPTVPVKPTIKGLAAGKDEVLEAGLEVVSR